jgi:hypothetical protein
MRFFATAAATVVAAHVAGKVVQHGGVKLMVKLGENAEHTPWKTNAIKSLREVRDYIDDWQGIVRKSEYYAGTNASKLFIEDAEGAYKVGGVAYSDGNPQAVRGFFFTKTEQESARRAGKEMPAVWRYSDEIQQKMVSQARRLPYELPAAYLAQRAVIDPLFGNEDKQKVNWANPADVISDFVTQSVKNAAFMFSPLELGQSAGSQTWRRLMTLGDDVTKLTPWQQQAYKGTVSLQAILGEVGHDAGTILNQGIQYSSQVTGSFSAGVNEARAASMDLVGTLYKNRSGAAAAAKAVQQKKVAQNLKWKNVSQKLLNHSALDYLPGPFKGIQSGVKAAGSKWNEMGDEFDALREVNQIGHRQFRAKYANNPGKTAALGRAMGMSSSPFEDLLAQLNSLGAVAPVQVGKNGRLSGEFAGGEFYKGQLSGLYNSHFQQKLRSAGVTTESIEQIQKMVKVEPPSLYGKTDKTQRVHIGDSEILTSHQDFMGNILDKLGLKNHQDAAKLRHVMPDALQQVDSMFQKKSFSQAVNKRIANEWNTMYNNEVPRIAATLASQGKPSYEIFAGALGQNEKRFLNRRTAQQLGMNMLDQHGRPVSHGAVVSRLASYGFGANNYDMQRAFLVTNGSIGKPWHAGGRNLFGFKSLGMADALSHGQIAKNDKQQQHLQDMLDHIRTQDPVGSVGDYGLGGVFQTKHGQIIDVNAIKRKFNKVTDTIADEFQVPLLHFSPLNMLGHQSRRAMRDSPLLQYIPGSSNQAFIGSKPYDSSFHMWSKKGIHGSKGSVTSYSYDNHTLIHDRLSGSFRPFAASGNSIAAHHLRLAVGDLGKGPAPADQSRSNTWSKFKSIFNIAEDQPDSLFGWAKRLKNRRSDINNPMIFARLLRGETVTEGGELLTLDPSTGAVVNAANQIRRTPAEVSHALNLLSSNVKTQGIPLSVQKSSSFKDLFKFDVTEDLPSLPKGQVNLADVHTPTQLQELMGSVVRQDVKRMSTMPSEVQSSMRRGQSMFVDQHLRGGTTPGFWTEPVPGASRSGTINTRFDKAKVDAEKYFLMRDALLNNRDFDQTISSLTSDLQVMRSNGQLSRADYIEARAAMLSLQVDYSHVSSYRSEGTTLENFQATLASLMTGRRADSVGDLAKDLQQGHVDTMSGRLQKLHPYLRRGLGTSRYEYAGTEYNPFGSRTALVPTFGTTFARNPRKAVAGALGFGTWNDPEGFSGTSIVSGHMVERLNRYADIVGLSLDPTKYKSPVDLYVRGLLGKRVLPIVGAGTIALTADRTVGGYVNPKDANGDRVYSPFVLGHAADVVAHAQMVLAGAVPGGQTYQQKKEELENGEVPIRAGRWWPLGNTPWKGGKVQYYRPSWLRRLKSGYSYTDQTFGSPLERLAFGYDFSPLRPLDPYRFERKHYQDRPYPVSGDYFSGPWGPVTSLLNNTVGRVLKPRLTMHEEELSQGLAGYAPIGDAGAFQAAPSAVIGGQGGGGGFSGGGYSTVKGSSGVGSPGRAGSAPMVNSSISAYNSSMSRAGKVSPATGSVMTAEAISSINQQYSQAAYAMPLQRGAMPPRIVPGVQPLSEGSFKYQAGKFGYQAQEMAGIYGFAFGALRSQLGYGEQDFVPNAPVLESANKAYGSTRGFWDLNLGGLGDMTSPMEGNWANIEFSEIARRFIPKERSGTQFINPIPNTMAKTAPWLPGDGSGYYLNFHQGDPYTKVNEGEMRLPGKGYERFNRLHPDQYGKYGIKDIHKILGDVAPWSTEYRAIDRMLGPNAGGQIATTRSQVEEMSHAHQFTPYKYRDTSAAELGMSELEFFARSEFEKLAHQDSFFNTKFLPHHTAVEDWERESVYGATFPEWQHPIKGFIAPMARRATQRNPIGAALFLGAAGTFFGRSGKAKAVGGLIGAATGLVAGTVGKGYQAITGQRYIPTERRKELALEEYSDMLNYVKYTRLQNQAQQQGDQSAAQYWMNQSKGTMYGGDIYSGDIQQQMLSMPKRKREYFEAMIQAPQSEHAQILSTAGRLERRFYEAAWGQPVEQRPDLEKYFSQHELPDPGWEGWQPGTSMEQVKIKMGQSQGIDMSEMGYYPQQVKEANLVNPSYPNFSKGTSHTAMQLRRLMREHGMHGDIVPVYTPYPGTRLDIQSGAYN